MEGLKYTVIKTKKQYNEYCGLLEELVSAPKQGKSTQDEIDLLTLLIEKYDEDHNTFAEVDPVRLLRSLMDDHQMKAKDLVNLLGVSKGYVSDFLNYKKALSKDVIRILAAHFGMRQDAFNRPYPLQNRRAKTRRKLKRSQRETV